MKLALLGVSCISLISARHLYVEKHGIRVELNMSTKKPMDAECLDMYLRSKGLEARDLSNLHFDKLENPKKLLALSKQFFEVNLTDDQVYEIAENDQINVLVTGHYQPKPYSLTSSQWGLVKAKIGLISKRLGVLTREKLGPKFDKLLSKMKESMYKFLDPISVLLSPAFKATKKGFARLFGMSMMEARKNKHSSKDLIQAFKSAVERMAAAPTEAILGVVTRVAFELMMRGVPMPAFITNRIARIVVGITNKSSLNRHIAAEAYAAEMKSTLPPISKSAVRETHQVPNHLKLVVTFVSRQAAEMKGEAEGLLKLIYNFDHTDESYQTIMRTICSLVLRAHSVNGVLLKDGPLQSADSDCPQQRMSLALLEERITGHFATLINHGQAIQLATAPQTSEQDRADSILLSDTTLSMLVYAVENVSKTAQTISTETEAWLAGTMVAPSQKTLQFEAKASSLESVDDQVDIDDMNGKIDDAVAYVIQKNSRSKTK